MKNKTNKQKPLKTRRTFIQSMIVFVVGLSIFAACKETMAGTETPALKVKPTAVYQSDVLLPKGVKAVWDLSKAYREKTPTRERICINGLWQWQPGDTKTDQLPTANWGYFKVPGNWPGIRHYYQKESQRVYAHPSWKDKPVDDLAAAWYQREISIPNNWGERRVVISLEYLNSIAEVYIDGKKAGQMLFPSGELDITPMCTPGSKHVLSMKVTALPQQDVVAVFNDSNAPRQGRGEVMRRGLCGDVYLIGEPSGARIENVKIITSFRKEEITFKTAQLNLAPGKQYTLRAVITDKERKVADFTSKSFREGDLKDGCITVTESWMPEKLWDIHTPQNMYEVTVSLLEGGDKLLDTAIPERFGFREFWINGRDFYLNGTRIFLSAVPFDNAQIGAALANYEAAKESMRRLQSFGINFVYTHNYDCQPGVHLSFAEILRAADDVGMLMALSQPHFRQYDWEKPDAEQSNGYAHHAEFYTQAAWNHPSVVFYSTSHNATGYADDMNPDMIDGIANPRNPRAISRAKLAQRAEAIIHHLDPSRIVYHHSSGNLSSMHTSNFYPNWVPIQEMNDWFEHWSTKGVKPLFLCEFGTPFPWDWAMYRGWYKGKREFGRARVPWEFCLAEWNSQFLGDKAFQISEFEKANLRWEAERFRAGEVWGRSDYPYKLNSRLLEERYPVYAMHLADNWRAFRTREISVNSPWIHSLYWKSLKDIDIGPRDFTVDWENLQRPGLSPDYISERSGRMDLDVAFELSDWIPTVAAEALIQNNKPLLAYIGGKPGAFTSKDHNFLPGETVEKQLIIINNCRRNISCDCSWSLNLPKTLSGSKTVSVATGHQEHIALRFGLPAGLTPGKYELKATFRFSNNEIQKDSFTIDVLPSATIKKQTAKTALFDPKGETGKLLDGMGLKYQSIDAGAGLSGYDVLIVGKRALNVNGPGLDVRNVRTGLKVIMFEQTSDVLEKRFGFRVQEYGLRNVYKRMSNHPVMAGLDVENLHDWHGAATILPPRLKAETNRNLFNGVQTVKWCGIPVTRVWRCGNTGNVASVLIEKPACGNFLPIIDGGFSLQYSPLMEYREGRGMVMFCQMDVTGRTESDPAAERLAQNIISYVSNWQPSAKRQVLYAGDPAGKSHLEKAGVSVSLYGDRKLSPDQVLVVGPRGGQQLSSNAADIGKWLKAGGHLLAIGLDRADVSALLPFKVTMKKEEHIADYFEPFNTTSPFAGIGPADVHNRAPKEFSLVSAGVTVIGDGVLAKAENANVVFCQLVPWQCDYSGEQHNIKQTYRRSSYLVTRLLGNMGIDGSTPVLARFNSPLDTEKTEKRWLDGLYLDEPEEWDDPYRFFRW